MLTGQQAPGPGLFYTRWQNKMSYINEALKKAQKDKDAVRRGYIYSIGKSGGTNRSFDKRFIYLSFIIILLAGLLIFLKLEKPSEQDHDTARESIGNIPEEVDDKNDNPLPVIDKQDQSIEDITEKANSKKENESNQEKLYAQAASLFKDGKLKEAEDIYKGILKQDPGDINSLNDLGVLFLHEGKYEDAINSLKKAVILKPKFANPYYNLACAYSLQNKGEKGMTYLLKAIEVDKKVKDWAKEDPDLDNLREYAEFTVITN